MHTLPCPETRRAPGTNKCIFLDNDTFSGNPWAAWAGSIATPLLPDFLSSFRRVRTRRTARSRAVNLLYYSDSKNASIILLRFTLPKGRHRFSAIASTFSQNREDNNQNRYTQSQAPNRCGKILQELLRQVLCAQLSLTDSAPEERRPS